MFKGTISQEEIDQGDPAQEPESLQIMYRFQADMIVCLDSDIEREREMDAMLGDHPESLFTVHLIREAANNVGFDMGRTHGVRFRLPPACHRTGAWRS